MKTKLRNVVAPLAILLAIITVVGLAIVQQTTKEQDDAVAVTVPVELASQGKAQHASVGLVLTIGNESAEGSQWNQAAAGAQVAIERFNRGGAQVSLITENDRGTAEGARAAVRALAQEGVSGIVVASAGPHVEAAIDEAKTLGIPAILPYEQGRGQAWSMQVPVAELSQHVLAATSQTQELIRLDQAGYLDLDVPAETQIRISQETDLAQLTSDLVKKTSDKTKKFALVVNADAYLTGRLMLALEETPINADVYLSPESSSPAFGQSLMRDQQISLIKALSLGAVSDDSLALQPDGQGRAMSAYLQAVRILSDSNVEVYGDQTFDSLALAADARSHDAVVAIIRGVETADSTAPADVAAALQTLELTPADGITASSYDFAQQDLISGRTTLLSPSVGNLHLRPTNGAEEAPQILWIAQEPWRTRFRLN
ncbi:MAG: hypothetical protein Q3965_02110 [Rothia sp. (in: high G+C Gram-positive bacteria)]|nr:hypothetical protein [Rothia sp. (in: high G+C Gram-positive bacteria)]